VGFAACESEHGAITFDMAGLGGAPLGQGSSCIQVPSECPFFPPLPGCRGTVHATFTLTLAGGTLTAPVVLHELWLTESTILQLTTGSVTSGTGAFAGLTGSLGCAGTLRFTETDLIPRIVCVVRLR
jgi:hypothetical protein